MLFVFFLLTRFSRVVVVVADVSFISEEVQRFRANLLTWPLLGQSRKATQRPALGRAPPSVWPWFLRLKNGPGLGVRIPPVPGSGLAHMDGGKVLVHMGSPPLGPMALTTTKTSENFFFFGERKTFVHLFLEKLQLLV